MNSLSSDPADFAVFEGDLNEEWENRFKNSKALGVDTEAMGLIHGRDRLCLVQICDHADNVACIKINRGQTSAPKLKALMENSSIEKVFHFARFDISALASNLEIVVNPIFCTKVASKLARTYTPRHGLKDLILELFEIELDKRSQSSDWGKVDKLSNAQLSYAANDARYLIAAKSILEEMLKREERWELAQKSFGCISIIAELDRSRFNNIFDH